MCEQTERQKRIYVTSKTHSLPPKKYWEFSFTETLFYKPVREFGIESLKVLTLSNKIPIPSSQRLEKENN